VAVVEYAHPTQGKLFVKIQNGYELEELHNVSALSPTNGQTIVYNTSTSLWEKSNSPVISGTTINSTTIGATTASTGAFTTLSASSTVSGTGFSTYLASPPAIGGTTPAAGTFTTLIGGGGSANYGQLTGGATTKAVEFKTIGSDTNVGLAIRSQGTGAIDLAAGSSGVNISNGGTVTAITRTALGVNYTSPPSVAISAPTTVGGVQSTATVELTLQTTTGIVTAGGSGYAVGDTFTVNGGTFSAQLRLQVLTVSGGAVTSVSSLNGGSYSVIPSTPATTTNIIGTGTGCTITPIWGVNSTFTITNAGSGYVEQPTVSFSGGGGSGATAYATVGSGAVIKWLGGTNNIQNASGNILQFQDGGNATPNALVIKNGGAPQLFPSVSNTDLYLSSAGTGNLRFYTNSVAQTQMVVSHTASAVNYVQVTGGATGNPATVTASAQGSDSNVNMRLTPKGTGTLLTATSATILDGTAIPAGGTAGAGYKLSSTSNFGIFFGSGAPTLSAAQGSLYLRSDGSSTSTRLYVNTNGSTTWTNVTTAA
jgi:hypothetical protein